MQLGLTISLATPMQAGEPPPEPTAAAPENTVAPVISGETVVGSELSVSEGTWTGYPTPTYTYQWRNATVNIGGATASTYTTVEGDVGDAIDCVVTATNSEGSANATSSNSITVTAVPTAPAQFGTGDWSVTDTESGGDIDIAIATLPNNGGSAITDLQYQIDAGAWASLGSATTGVYTISGLTDDVEVNVAVRAVNAVGTGTASATKAVTPTAGAGAAGDSLLLFNEGGVTLLQTGMM